MGLSNDFGRHREEMREEIDRLESRSDQESKQDQRQEPLPPDVADAFRSPRARRYANK